MLRCIPLVGLLALLLAPPPAWAQSGDPAGIGAYFSTVNLYIYPDGPEEGRRTLVRPNNAFNVVDFTTDSEDRLWYRIIYPQGSETVEGEGWTVAEPHELISGRGASVQVFTRIPGQANGPFETYNLPAIGLELLQETRPSERFPEVTWQKVRYSMERPLRAWAAAAAGIYRPGRRAGFMRASHQAMTEHEVPEEKRMRLLAGVVRIGDTPLEVEWSLGQPLRTQEEVIEETRRTTWHYAEMRIQFENAVVKQIN